MSSNNNDNKLTPQQALVEEVRRDALTVKYMLESENGKVLMNLLEIECNPEKLIGQTPEQTAYNVGKRDVYMYLLLILRTREED